MILSSLNQFQSINCGHYQSSSLLFTSHHLIQLLFTTWYSRSLITHQTTLPRSTAALEQIQQSSVSASVQPRLHSRHVPRSVPPVVLWHFPVSITSLVKVGSQPYEGTLAGSRSFIQAPLGSSSATSFSRVGDNATSRHISD
jgi:hypothetical protein